DLETAGPGSPAVHLDHEPAEVVRLRERPLDLGRDRPSVGRRDRPEERLHVFAADELEQEGDVVRRRPAQPDRRHGSGTGATRRPNVTSPAASVTPARIRTRPPTSAAVTGSPSSVTP